MLRADRHELVGIVVAMILLAACGPVCGPSLPAAAGWKITFSGPFAGTLSHGTSNCQIFSGSKRFDYLLRTTLNAKDLVLSLTVYSNYSGPGTYPVGSVLDGSGEVRFDVASAYQGATTTGAGTLAVKSDGKSGTVDSDLSGGEHIKGSWICDQLETLTG